MAQLYVYLTFDGNCREAMSFYKECLGGELSLSTVGDSPMAGQMPPDAKNRIIHSVLKNDDITLMASDMMGPGGITQGNTISLCLVGKNKQELDTYFTKLSNGGKIATQLVEEFFGTFGDLTDKFGIRWMFQADPEK